MMLQFLQRFALISIAVKIVSCNASDYAFNSEQGEIDETGNKPNIPLAVCTIDYTVPQVCTGIGGWTPVSVVGKGFAFCTQGNICGAEIGNCPRAQNGLPSGSHCALISEGVYGCVENEPCQLPEFKEHKDCTVPPITPEVTPVHSQPAQQNPALPEELSVQQPEISPAGNDPDPQKPHNEDTPNKEQQGKQSKENNDYGASPNEAEPKSTQQESGQDQHNVVNPQVESIPHSVPSGKDYTLDQDQHEASGMEKEKSEGGTDRHSPLSNMDGGIEHESVPVHPSKNQELQDLSPDIIPTLDDKDYEVKQTEKIVETPCPELQDDEDYEESNAESAPVDPSSLDDETSLDITHQQHDSKNNESKEEVEQGNHESIDDNRDEDTSVQEIEQAFDIDSPDINSEENVNLPGNGLPQIPDQIIGHENKIDQEDSTKGNKEGVEQGNYESIDDTHDKHSPGHEIGQFTDGDSVDIDLATTGNPTENILPQIPDQKHYQDDLIDDSVDANSDDEVDDDLGEESCSSDGDEQNNESEEINDSEEHHIPQVTPRPNDHSYFHGISPFRRLRGMHISK